MYSNRMGNITNAVLNEDEINHLWQGLKALEKYGTDPSCVGVIDNDLVEKLIVELAKASNDYMSNNRGPLSKERCKSLQEHSERMVRLSRITRERQQKEIDRIVRKYLAREQAEGLGKISSEGITEKDIAGHKPDMSHVQKVKKGKKK